MIRPVQQNEALVALPGKIQRVLIRLMDIRLPMISSRAENHRAGRLFCSFRRNKVHPRLPVGIVIITIILVICIGCHRWRILPRPQQNRLRRVALLLNGSPKRPELLRFFPQHLRIRLIFQPQRPLRQLHDLIDRILNTVIHHLRGAHPLRAENPSGCFRLLLQFLPLGIIPSCLHFIPPAAVLAAPLSPYSRQPYTVWRTRI